MWSGVVNPRWQNALRYVSLCRVIFHSCFVWNIYEKYSNKEKYVSCLKCRLRLTHCSVSFVHRHLKVELVSTEYIKGVATLDLCDFYQSIFIHELLKSNIPTYEYRIVQYLLCAFNMQHIEKLRWKKLRLGFVLFIFSTYWLVNE